MDYERIYKILGDATPLGRDCGALCGKNCCKGDERTGMLLFPGEQTSLSVTENDGRRIAVCNGACNRDERPLSCRIFPFFPVEDNGRIKIIADMRGINVCPMVTHTDEIRFSRHFMRRMRKVGRVLYSDPECAAFMRETAADIDDILRINEMIK